MANLLTKIADKVLRRIYNYRSSVTGRYVTKAYAEANPSTTYRVRA